MPRKFLLSTAALACTVLVAACGNNDGGANDQSNDAVNAAQDAAGAVTGVGTAAVGAVSAGAFVRDAAISDMYEIEASKMALQRSKDAQVKMAAQKLIDDHTKSSDELKTIISGGGVDATVPTALDERRMGMIDNLRGASDADFDKVWLDQQTMAHREGVLLFNGYATAGSNDQLKAFASKTAPTLQSHLDMITGLDRGGADGTSTGG